MANVLFHEKRVMVAGATLPFIELVVTEADKRTIINLAGYAAWFTFWMRGALALTIMTKQGYIYNAAQGLVRYEWDGSENLVTGELRYQCTIYNRGTIDQQYQQEYCEMSSEIFLRKVIAA